MLAIAGCSSLGGPSPGAGPDLASLDLASAMFAVDMPLSVEPADGPRVVFGTSLDVTLDRADAEAVMSALPPPAEGRSYAVYAFPNAQRANVRAVQSAVRAGQGGRLAIQPRFCVTADARKAADLISVIAVAPGQRPVTIVGPETLSALEARTGTVLPPCAGHSG
jgi:hypothetical protein